MLHSCENCWFNGLQYGALGLPVGYCTRHRKVLNAADFTTCGQHLRKDLSLHRAQAVAELHAARYPGDVIVRIYDEAQANEEVSSNGKDLDTLRKDPVAEAASDYGLLDSKIESLAQLKALPGARAEVAMLSLARGYVRNCVMRDGRWTSGLHIYWWTKKRLAETPDIAVGDLRTTGGIQLSRQVELTAWSIVMLRLTLIDDIAIYAGTDNHPVGGATGLLQRYAASADSFSLAKLAKWIRAEALPILDEALPWDGFSRLCREMHREAGGEAMTGGVRAESAD